jgi:hypothetical protein
MNAEIEIIEVKTTLLNGGWIGSAKINGKLFTGEFGPSETYHFDDGDVDITWSWFLNLSE